MQARRISRELALLSTSQLPNNPKQLETQDLSAVMVAAIRTLTTEAQDALETAAADLNRSRDRLLSSETRTTDIESAKAMLEDAITTTQAAINRVATALEWPEFVQLANQREVRAYALELLSHLAKHRAEIDALLTQALVDWQLSRLAQIDRDILRIAVTELVYLGQPPQVAINEAVVLAKRYSEAEGYRFINGVLRRVADQLQAKSP